MGVLKVIGRLAPVAAAGLAAGWYLRRQGLIGGLGRPELVPPSASGPVGEPGPRPATGSATADEPPAAEEPREEPPEPIEAHAEAVEAVSDAADVTAVVEDLLAFAPGEEAEVVDAEVVEDEDEPERPAPDGP